MISCDEIILSYQERGMYRSIVGNDQLQEKVNVKDQDKFFFFLKRILLFVNYLNNNRIINYNVLKTTTNKKNKK